MDLELHSQEDVDSYTEDDDMLVEIYMLEYRRGNKLRDLPPSPELLNAAVTVGDDALVVKLVREGVDSGEALMTAVTLNDMKMFRRVFHKNINAFVHACRLGRTQMVEMFAAARMPCWVINDAINAGQLDVVKILYQRCWQDISQDAIRKCVSDSNIPMVSYLLDAGFSSIRVFKAAMYVDSLTVATLLVDRALPLHNPIEHSFRSNRLDVTDMLLARGYREDDALVLMLRFNDVKRAARLIVNGSVHPRAYKLAGKLGNRDLIAMMINRGFPNIQDGILSAVETNDLEMVRFFVENGTPYTAAMIKAEAEGRDDIVEYLSSLD